MLLRLLTAVQVDREPAAEGVGTRQQYRPHSVHRLDTDSSSLKADARIFYIVFSSPFQEISRYSNQHFARHSPVDQPRIWFNLTICR